MVSIAADTLEAAGAVEAQNGWSEQLDHDINALRRFRDALKKSEKAAPVPVLVPEGEAPLTAGWVEAVLIVLESSLVPYIVTIFG